MFIYDYHDWPDFYWDADAISAQLGEVRHRQGKILGQMEALGFPLQKEALLQTLTLDVVKSSEIEGELLNREQVRSSIAQRLGIEIAGTVKAERDVEGVVEMMLDATQRYAEPVTAERLQGWHAALFPTGYSGIHKIKVGGWRDAEMQVTSGNMGKEIVHFEAPAPRKVPHEMERFLKWMNSEQLLDPVLKAGIAHLWFVTIHPFDDGNGRIARAIADLQLARADKSPQRFYSMSAQIQQERNAYYDMLESTQRSDLDVTQWLSWFLDCLYRSMENTNDTVAKTIARGKFWDIHQKTEFNLRQQKLLQLLLDNFFGNLNVSKYAKITKTSTDTALRDIQDLIQKGILEQQGAGRNTAYVFKNLTSV
jgi:Fic family protein